MILQKGGPLVGLKRRMEIREHVETRAEMGESVCWKFLRNS